MDQNRNSKISLIINIILLISVIILFIMQFKKTNNNTSANKASSEEVDTNVVVNAKMPANFTVAYVNTDSLAVQYKYYQEANKKIEAFEAQLQSQYESAAKKLQNDYENYVKAGKAGLLTLQQQKDTEANLSKQQEDIGAMQQSLSQQSAAKRQEISGQVTDTLLKFINAYRIEKNYTLILQYGSMSGLLSATPELDITKDVVKRLNAKYDFDKNHK